MSSAVTQSSTTNGPPGNDSVPRQDHETKQFPGYKRIFSVETAIAAASDTFPRTKTDATPQFPYSHHRGKPGST
jgi:hypothetical protein